MIKTDFQLKLHDLITNPEYDSLEPKWKERKKNDGMWYVVDWEGLVNEILDKGYNLCDLSIEMEHGKSFLHGASVKGSRLRGIDVDVLEDLTGISLKKYAKPFVPKRQRDKEKSNESKPRPKPRPKVFPKRQKRVLRVDDGTIYCSLTEAARENGVTPASLSVCIKKGYKCGGREFKYVEDIQIL